MELRKACEKCSRYRGKRVSGTLSTDEGCALGLSIIETQQQLVKLSGEVL